MTPARFVTRFAPSPTGFLHRGHAYSALTAAAAARRARGRFLLRTEDIDTLRCQPRFEAAIAEDLAWLGIDWEKPVRRQSEHILTYRAALMALRERNLLYRCFRTRRDLVDDIARAPHAAVAPFVGQAAPAAEEAALMSADRPFAWRLSLDAARRALPGFDRLSFVEQGRGPEGQHGLIAARPESAGDVILARKDLGVSYHLAVVVDDAAQDVTHVIRGQDLFGAAHIQRLLQALLNLPTPIYRHHPLILRPDGKRFAKRDTAETLRELRQRGVMAAAIHKELGF